MYYCGNSGFVGKRLQYRKHMIPHILLQVRMQKLLGNIGGLKTREVVFENRGKTGSESLLSHKKSKIKRPESPE